MRSHKKITMENQTRIRRQLYYYLILFSGLQIITTMYYNFDALKRNRIWKIRLGDKNYKFFQFGLYTLFVNAFLYHSLSKPLYRGTSGFKIQYAFVLMNLLQFAAIICFFSTLFQYSHEQIFAVIQLFIYIPVFGIGTAINYFAWKQLKPKKLTYEGSWLLSRRRDWGIAGTFFSASQMLMLCWEISMNIYETVEFKDWFQKHFGLYVASQGVMFLGALGYHVLGLKVSKGACSSSCHRSLNHICLLFIIIEFIGMLMYVIASIIQDQVWLNYDHVLVFALGTVVSGLGNSYVSRRTMTEDLESHEKEMTYDELVSK